jgi:hypothetical protein
MDCSIDANVECNLDMEVDCDGYCDVDGVLECNGEFMGDFSLEEAVQWVEENTSFDVTYEGDAQCEGNACEAKGSCELKCDVGNGFLRRGLLFALVSAALALLD